MLFRIGHDASPFAHGDVVGRVKGRARYLSEGARQLPVVAAPQGVAVVLYQPEVMAAGDFADRFQVEGIAHGMGQKDGAGPRADCRCDLVGKDVVGSYPDIDEDGDKPVLDDRGNRGGEARCCGDYLVSRFEPPVAQLGRGEGAHCDEVGGRAAVHEDRV